MGAEERWAQQKEWDDERRFELEINIDFDITGKGETCQVRKCDEPAVKRYEVKRVQDSSGEMVDLCADHASDETAFDVYREE